MCVRLRELRSNEALCRYDNITRKEDNPMSSLKDETVTMAHGAGGRQTSELIDKIFAAHFANPDLTADDAAVLIPPAGKMAVSTDGFIVSPAFFPGGNIGKLSVCGTVNDLACMGAVSYTHLKSYRSDVIQRQTQQSIFWAENRFVRS